jgi:trimethylamine:corrinoid methyltransferase-like protein
MHRAALERARTLLRDHRPVPMDPAIDAELDRIIADHARAAGAELAGVG